jgi:hypothetical protein
LARLAQFDTDIGWMRAVPASPSSAASRSALELLSDIVVRPAIREHDFARVRQLRLHGPQLRDIPGTVADRAFLKRSTARIHAAIPRSAAKRRWRR